MEDQYYFIGRGKLLVSKLDASGNPGKFEWLGNVPNLTISIESRQIEHYEKVTGLNLIDKIINNGQLVTVDFVVENFVIKNLVKFLRGTYEVIPAPIIETVTVYPGAYSIIAPNITQWDSLTDVSETTTYIEGVDYTVDSQSGLLFIPLGSSITEGQEVKPNYTAGAMNEIVGFADQAEYYQLFFAGLNLANELDPLLVDIYKFYLHPLSRLDLINPSLTQFQVTGTACYDTNQASEELGGRFLRTVINPIGG